MSRLDKELSRLYVYASMLADEDTRVSEPQGMQQEMEQIYAEFGAQAAYIEPEVLRIGKAAIDKALAAEPRLKPYAFYLSDIVRRAAHTLNESEEKILADASPLAGSASNIYGILANADFPYPQITLSDGQTVKVDQAGYGELRTSPNRKDRELAMSAFFKALGSFGRTFGTTMNSSVQKSLFYAKARKYPTTLEMALNGPNIPTSVYMRLIDGVNKSLPTFHRYLRLRKRMMGITDQLHYYDLYAPLVASVESEVHARGSAETRARRRWRRSERSTSPWCSARSTSAGSTGMRPRASDRGLLERRRLRRAPYMLLNYLGQYNDMSTLTHELGHTMHSYFSNKTQPYPTANYATFVAEVASTFNEALLIEHMLKQIKDEPTRLSLLGNYLEGIKSTVPSPQPQPAASVSTTTAWPEASPSTSPERSATENEMPLTSADGLASAQSARAAAEAEPSRSSLNAASGPTGDSGAESATRGSNRPGTSPRRRPTRPRWCSRPRCPSPDRSGCRGAASPGPTRWPWRRPSPAPRSARWRRRPTPEPARSRSEPHRRDGPGWCRWFRTACAGSPSYHDRSWSRSSSRPRGTASWPRPLGGWPSRSRR